MVCHRCVIVVEDILQQESIRFQKVIFGEIHLFDELNPEQKDRLVKAFDKVGFELIDDHSSALIEKIKQLVIKRARNEVDVLVRDLLHVLGHDELARGDQTKNAERTIVGKIASDNFRELVVRVDQVQVLATG